MLSGVGVCRSPGRPPCRSASDLLGIRQIGQDMASLRRVRVQLFGFKGGPGVSTFYFLDTDTALTSLHTLYEGMSSTFPVGVSVIIEPSGDIIESTTGVITGAWGGNPQALVVGTSAGPYAAPAGVLLGWETTTILDGRRLRGRTFIVPAANGIFGADGTINDATRTALASLAAQFSIEQNLSFVIWHRPFAGRPAVGTIPAKPAHLGGHGLVTSARVPDKVVVLRSRRD